MKKFAISLVMIVLAMVMIVLGGGCTANERAKHWGGTATYNIPAGQKVVTCSWKASDNSTELWILTRPMHSNDVAETFTYTEKSQFGVMEGKVLLVESRE